VAASIQQAQITEGAAADVLITPQSSLIDALKTQGLVDVYSQIVLAKDALVLAGPKDSSLDISLAHGFPAELLITQMGGEPGFVVGNPQNLPEGVYGKEALRAMNVSADLEPYTLYVKRRDQMLEMLSTKDYGVVFNSDVAGRDAIRVLDRFPDNSYQPIQYYAVILAGDNMASARKFLDYLKSDAAKRVLRANGFAAD
jgi:molybdate transport system substrate-binding protein